MSSSCERAGVAVVLAALLSACGAGSPAEAGANPPSFLMPTSCSAAPAPTPADAPVISLRGAPVVDQALNASYADAGATVADAQGADLSARLTVRGLNGVDTSRAGDYLIRYSATAANGTAAREVLRLVRVHAGAFAARSLRPAGSTSTAMGYVERLPQRYGADPAERFPLIVFLHGSGEVGGDLGLLTGTSVPGSRDVTAALAPDQAGGAQAFVVLFPQRCANVVTAGEVRAFLDFAVHAYLVDPARVYLVGHSAGGSQIWSALAAMQDQVAAVAPIAGFDVGADVCSFKDVPMWSFHAQDDPIVPVAHSIAVTNRLNACVPAPRERARLTVYPSGGHVVDTRTLDLSAVGSGDARYDVYTPDLYTWFLQHRLPR